MKLRKRQQSSSKDTASPTKDNSAQIVSPVKRKKEPAQRKKTAKKVRANASAGRSAPVAIPSDDSDSQEENEISTVHESQENNSGANIVPAPFGLYRFICQWEVSIQNTSMGNATALTTIQCRRKYLRTDGPNGSIDHLCNFHLPKLLESESPLQCSWGGCKSGEKIFADFNELKDHVAAHAGVSTGLPSL